MALNIKDPEIDRLARELAQATGESISTAVKVALEERLRRLRRAGAATSQRAPVQRFVDRGRSRPTLDTRTADEILGYDELGLPR